MIYIHYWNARPSNRFKRENILLGGGAKVKSTLLRDPSTVNNPLSDIWVNSVSYVSKNKSAKLGYINTIYNREE